MTRIDFYILPDADTPLVTTACRLCEKAAQAGATIYVHVPDPELTAALDTALWTFRQGSFISHERLKDQHDLPLPMVLIGAAEPPPEINGVLLNLDREVPPFFSRFDRVCEVVASDDAAKAASRVRYKFYRDRGYELTTHNL